MASLSFVKRKDLISKLKQFSFTGPYSGGQHQFMLKDKLRRNLLINIKVILVYTC